MTQKYRMMMLLTTVLAMALVGCSSKPVAKPTPIPVVTRSASSAPPSSSGGAVTASGEIAPAQKASLSFPLAGRVQTVKVKSGDPVQSGDVLITLETSRLEAEVTRARAALDAAQAQLAQIKAGAQPAQVAAAEQAIKEAEAAQWRASAQLAQLQSGARAADVAAAEAEVARLAAELDRAQKAYDGVLAGRAAAKEYGVPGGGLGQYEEQMRAQLNAIRASYGVAQKRLEQIKAGPTKNELDAARANVAAAEAAKARAQAQLDLIKAGPMVEQIALAEANIAQARAVLDLAQIALDQATLHAPFAGTIATLDINPGEMAAPNQPILTLADLSRLQVETTDLSEKDVSRVKVGQAATVYVEALGKEVKGRVKSIALRATKVGGDVVYTVVVELDEQPAGLRWGMKVKVDITA